MRGASSRAAKIDHTGSLFGPIPQDQIPASADFQLWVQASDQPLPRRLVINFVALKGEPEYLARIQSWEIDPKIDPAQFAFVPPAGAERTEPQRAPSE